ncbi:DUF6685 family protein [Stutzerimonas xanthomarina]|uniref:Uncharacterized protein n=2 Tax=Stutzerimonas xanthomarina TaxID=271420 RepID=A0A1M5RVL7_9GAMM|nr:DUF6685 family protein [Stutzerimonas xanthomarina]MCP9339341.1 hypothetical protein [Stutzerimonas xanthomarina]SEH93635.1 hypothetical protein SAMN05216535_2799 [Stutzerimonas xanthomarina]SHH30367.1 hypothetical protein SAMN02744645_3281 [Stutzerimonas xanthomarina DSM 18231]
MMDLPESMPPVNSRIVRFAQRLGLTGKSPRQILEHASRISLPFAPLSEPAPSIFWQDGPCLQRFVDLPRSALSGPIQEDKARAHAALTRLVRQERSAYPSLDLRQVDGLGGQSLDEATYPTFEALAATPACRQLRIISYKDFLRTITTALPEFLAQAPIELRQASWLGERIYWSGEHHAEAFACAIAYARLRGLEVNLPCELTDYRLDAAGLQALDNEYHAITMPAQAWSDRAFMGLLLEAKIAYARLTLLRNINNSELLLLDKRQPAANALGQGLKLAGAPDMVRYLRDLPQITRFRLGNRAIQAD